jgi:hypothetical protein
MYLFLIPVAIVIVTALVFFIISKTKVRPEVEPIGYEAALLPTSKTTKPKKTENKKASKNTPKQQSLAKMEAKPKRAIKAKK